MTEKVPCEECEADALDWRTVYPMDRTGRDLCEVQTEAYWEEQFWLQEVQRCGGEAAFR